MLSLLAALALAVAEPAPAPPPAPQAEAKPAPLTADQAVDANGVPAWAKRKHKQPVQACETRPNIGIEPWRQRYDSSGRDRLKPRPELNTCR